jgi:hypothetical protein
MSTPADPGTICNSIEQALVDIARGATGSVKRTRVGFIDSLRSPINTIGSPIMVDQGDGHRRTVDVQYLQRITEAAIDTTCPADCETTNERGYFETTYDISLYAGHEEKLNESYVAKLCEGQSDFVQKLLNSSFNAILESMENQLIDQMALNFGINVTTGNNNRRDVQLLNGANNNEIIANNYAAWVDAELMDDNKFHAAPIVVGQGLFSQFNWQKNIGCCNDLGQNMAELTSQAGYSYFKSQRMNAQLGDDEIIVYEPGALQLLTYYKYRTATTSPLFNNPGAYSSFEMVNGAARGIIRDPFTGMEMNWKVIPDACGDYYWWRMSVEFDLAVLPDDMYQNSDELDGNNGTLHYRVTNA